MATQYFEAAAKWRGAIAAAPQPTPQLLRYIIREDLIIICFDARIVQFVLSTMVDVLQFDMEQRVRSSANPKVHVLQVEGFSLRLHHYKRKDRGTP
jgi:hypothetical protein